MKLQLSTSMKYYAFLCFHINHSVCRLKCKERNVSSNYLDREQLEKQVKSNQDIFLRTRIQLRKDQFLLTDDSK